MNHKSISPCRALIRLVLIIVFAMTFLSGCNAGDDKLELTKYMGGTIKNFQRKTGVKLSEEGTGVYSLEGTLQLIAPKGKISSIILLPEGTKYSMFGVKLGTRKAEAEQAFTKTYGQEQAKAIKSAENLLVYTYRNEKSELYVSYDIDTDSVAGLSYYLLTKEEAQEDNTEHVNSGELIAMVGDIRVYYNEAMVYLKSVQENYETEYGKGIWSVDIFGDGKSFGEHIKGEVINQITELKIIGEKAKEEGITLTEDELAEAKALAHEHFEGLSDADIDKYLITRELLEKVYADNMLAEKAFETLTLNVDTNVSDLEAKQITVQHLLIYGAEVDEDGKITPFSAEERNNAYDKARALLEQAKETDDFYTLAETNSEAETIEYTFGRGQGPKEYSAAFEQAAFTLKTGEVSDLISTEYGWHIIYCVSDFNKDATIQVKENIIEERRTKLFADLYAQWSADYDVVINSEAWDAVSLEE